MGGEANAIGFCALVSGQPIARVEAGEDAGWHETAQKISRSLTGSKLTSNFK
jgi:hypothetical protein